MYYCAQTNQTDYILFLDQEKAFDRVDRSVLHQAIEQFNFPRSLKIQIKLSNEPRSQRFHESFVKFYG